MNVEETNSNSLLERFKSCGCSLLMALPFLGAGIYIMGISYGFLPSDPESFVAPPGIVGLAGAFFVVGGLMVLLYGAFGGAGADEATRQKNPIFRALNKLLGLAFLTLFGLIFTWAGFGPGERVFEGGISIPKFSDLNTLLGRGVFGLIGVAILLAALASALSPIYFGLRKIYQKIKGSPGGDSDIRER